MGAPGACLGWLAAADAHIDAAMIAAATEAAARRIPRHGSTTFSPGVKLRLPPIRRDLPVLEPTTLIRSLRGDQLPVRIARGDLAREGPDVGDLLDALGIAHDHLARPVPRRRDQLAHELDRHVRHDALELRLDDVGGLDADETLIHQLAAVLALGYGLGESVVDVTAQQVLERLAIAFGERRDDELVGRPRTLQEGVGIEGL